MISEWKDSSPTIDDREVCKRLVDLFLVSVLLDAGAGNRWTYQEPGTHDVYARSEGLGVASVHMFQAGLFSGDSNQPCRADGVGNISFKWERDTEFSSFSIMLFRSRGAFANHSRKDCLCDASNL